MKTVDDYIETAVKSNYCHSYSPTLVSVNKTKGNQFSPKYFNGVLDKFELSNEGGFRVITMRVITNEEWKFVDENDLSTSVNTGKQLKLPDELVSRLLEI